MPIYINIKKTKNKRQIERIKIRTYRLYTFENYKNILLDNNEWRRFWDPKMSIDDRWNIMLSIIIDSIDKLCPVKIIARRNDQYPWIDKELADAISKKWTLYKQATSKKENDDQWHEYKEQRAYVRKLFVGKKRQYITRTLDANRDDPKKFWKEINKNLHFGKTKATTNIITIKNKEGIHVAGPEASDVLNQHYATVGETLAKKFVNTPNPNIPDLIPLPYNLMRFRFVGIKEIGNLTRLLKNSKPSGVVNLKTEILKDALKILVIEFTFLINECLDKSYVPAMWKKGIITPIPKVTPAQYPVDYRPISVLPATSKILERAVHDQLVYFLESHGLLDHRQHGFRKDHSTLSAIYEVTQFLYNSMDHGKITYCAFIDYSKAFDTLDHKILLYKMSKLGISQPVLQWCKCYLSGRKQSVKNGDYISEELTVQYGTPGIHSRSTFLYYIC